MLVVDVGIQVVKQGRSAIAERTTDQRFNVGDLGCQILNGHDSCAQSISGAFIGRLLIRLDEKRNGRRVAIAHFFEVDDGIVITSNVFDVGIGLNGA